MQDFISIDFETAIYSPESAISIGLVKYCNYKAVDTYYSLIRPPKLYIRPEFTQIHGLTIDDVKDAPDFKNIWENDICGFIEDTPLAAHNAIFDMRVLKAALEWYNLPVPNLPYFCTRDLSRNTWPDLPSYALTSLGKNFDIVYNAHNALDDAMTCGKLVQLSAEKFNIQNSITDLLEKARLEIKYLSNVTESKQNE